ncbi:MAG: MFS transporter [Actinomycetota bacterium]|nr:MFS transporter [Actinomycetota bacterium]
MRSPDSPPHEVGPGDGGSGERVHHQVTFLVLALATLAYAMLQSLVNPVLPTIQRHLHTTQANVTWVLTAYLLAASIATPVVGRAGDIVGKKKALVAVLVFLAAGTVLAAVAPTIGVMIVARLVQGAGGALLPLAFGIVRDEFPRKDVARAVGTIAALIAVGGGLGIVLAGPIVDSLGYRYLFWIPLVIVVVALIAAVMVVPESKTRAPGRLSAGPAILLTLWLVAVLIAVSEASNWGWGSGRTLGLLALGLALVPVWVLAESRSADPVVDMKMMRVPVVATTNLAALLLGIPMYSVMAFLPEFVQTPRSSGYGFGASITASGLFLLPLTAVMFFFGLWSGRLADRYGSKPVLIAGAVLTAASCGMLTFAHHQRWEIYVATAVVGAGLGFSFSAMSNLIVESVPVTQVGVASGMNANIRTIGGSIGAAVTGTIITSGMSGAGTPLEAGYTHAFLFLFIAAAGTAGASLLIPGAGRLATPSPIGTGAAGGTVLVHNAEAAIIAGAPIVEAE